VRHQYISDSRLFLFLAIIIHIRGYGCSRLLQLHIAALPCFYFARQASDLFCECFIWQARQYVWAVPTAPQNVKFAIFFAPWGPLWGHQYKLFIIKYLVTGRGCVGIFRHSADSQICSSVMFEIDTSPIPTLFGYTTLGEFSTERDLAFNILHHVHAVLPALLLFGTSMWIVHRKSSLGGLVDSFITPLC